MATAASVPSVVGAQSRRGIIGVKPGDVYWAGSELGAQENSYSDTFKRARVRADPLRVCVCVCFFL